MDIRESGRKGSKAVVVTKDPETVRRLLTPFKAGGRGEAQVCAPLRAAPWFEPSTLGLCHHRHLVFLPPLPAWVSRPGFGSKVPHPRKAFSPWQTRAVITNSAVHASNLIEEIYSCIYLVNEHSFPITPE